MEARPHSSFPLKLFLLIVLLPVALAAAGVWQYTRADSHSGLLLQVNRSIAAIEAAQQRAGNPDVVLTTPDGKRYTASVILQRNKAFRTRLLSNTWWQRTVCRPLAAAVALFGLAGAAMGLYGLFTVRRAGRRALHSREALLQGFREGLRKLPWLIGSIGVFIALAVALGGAFELVNFASRGVSGRGAVKLVGFGALVIGALFFFGGKLVWNIYATSKAVFEREPLRLMGKNVTREEAPLVWEFVKSVADGAGATMPDAIVLGLDEGFFVTEHPVALLNGEPVPEGRVLYLPLPYMAYMTRPEAAAVIGHELGHFTGADTEYSLMFSPIYATAVNNLLAVDAAADDDNGLMGLVAKPAMMFGVYYLDSFDLAVQHWSREREFAADAMGARIAGSEAIALSLLRISVLAPHVYQALGECWAKGGRLEGGVLNRVRELVREHGLGDPAEHLEEIQAHPTDSHPATRQRLMAVNVPVTPDLLARARSTEESPLLKELGLEAGAPAGQEGAARTGWDILGCGTGHVRPSAGLSAALEAEFSKAARENAEGMEEQLREAALLGTERIVVYETTAIGQAGGIVLILIGAVAVVAGLIKGSLAAFTLGSIAIFSGLWLFSRLRRQNRKPVMTLTADGFRAGNMDREVPWSSVCDYGIMTRSTYGVQTSVEITVELAEGYVPAESSDDRRVRFKPERHALLVTMMGLARPYKVEGFAEAFHNHWRGGMAREQLREKEAAA